MSDDPTSEPVPEQRAETQKAKTLEAAGWGFLLVWLGITTLYYVPLSLVAFGSLLVGMVIMFVVGVRSDLRVRRILRERFMDEEALEPGRRDRNQVDLFTSGSP